MASTYTPNKDFELPGYNDYVDNWNTPVNTNFTEIDQALGGSTLLNVTGITGDVTLTVSQYRPQQIIISGTLSANVRYRIPSGVGGQWTVTNNATGAFVITFNSVAGGGNLIIPSGTTIISCDGTSSGMRLSVSSTGVTRVDTFSGGTTGLTPATPSVANIVLGGTLNIANGGTGTSTAPIGGQILVGTNSGAYTLAQIQGGSGISVVNGDGSITINAASTAGGTVTSVNVSGGATGLTATGGPITNSGTITLGGTLGIGYGGTGITATPANGQLLIGTGTGYQLGALTAGSGINVSSPSPGNITIAATGGGGTVTSVNVSGGTTGLTALGGPIIGAGTITLGGTLVPANGGTGTGNVPTSGQIPIGNASGTYTVAGLTQGTGIGISTGSGSITISNSGVTSFSAGTTGLSVSGSTGAVTLSGTLDVDNGGTGSTTASGARTNLGAAASGAVTSSNITMSTARILGRTTAATGAIEEITVGTGLSLSAGSLTNSGVTSLSTTGTGLTVSGSTGSVTIAGTLDVDNGGTGTATAFTAGSVVFAGASGIYTQDNANFFWNDSTNRLGLTTATPAETLDVGTGNAKAAQFKLASNSARFWTDTTFTNLNFNSTSSISYNGSTQYDVSIEGTVRLSISNTVAVYGTVSSTSAGVYGLQGINTGTSGGNGAVGISTGSGGYAFRSISGGYSPFTGCHDGLILKTSNPSPGDLLIDGVVVGKKLSDVITEVSTSTTPNQPAIGVFVQTYPTAPENVPPALIGPNGQPEPAWDIYAPTHNLVVINSVGEGCLNVVGEGGNIKKGDLLVTSSTPGKAMKQADDIIRNYTVARAREDAVFAAGEEKQIACIYLCG